VIAAPSARARFVLIERHLLVALFALTATVVLTRHEMWMDELNPWVIARDAHSLRQLFFNMRFEPHPALWYLCLYALTRFTSNPVAMQVLHGAIATASVAVLSYLSPFRRRDVWLIAFGYYFVFEYCAISRGYALGILLLLLACALATRPRPQPLAIAILLALAANTSLYGVILACALAIASAPLLYRQSRWQLVAGLTLLAAAVAISLQTLTPRPGNVYGAERHLAWSTGRADSVVRLIGDAYVPLPDFALPSQWNSNLIETWTRLIPNAGHYVPLDLGLLILAAALFHLRTRAIAAAGLLAGTAVTLAPMYIEYSAGYRHHGHLFILLLAVMWIAATSGARTPRWLTPILVANVVAGIFFVGADIVRPFSESKAVADFLAQQGDRLPVVVAQPGLLSYQGPELSAYLQRRLYYASGGGLDKGSYLQYDQAHLRGASATEIANEIDLLSRSTGSDVLVVTSHWDSPILGEPIFTPRVPTIEGDERETVVHRYIHRRETE
jgi:hypothetical protein